MKFEYRSVSIDLSHNLQSFWILNTDVEAGKLVYPIKRLSLSSELRLNDPINSIRLIYHAIPSSCFYTINASRIICRRLKKLTEPSGKIRDPHFSS